MNCMILVGGKGKRMRPFTWFTPKPLLPIFGKPILDHIIDYLSFFGVRDIYLKIYYKPIQFLENYPDFKFIYEKEEEEISVNKLLRVYPELKNDFLIVVNGDTLTNLDLLSMFKMSKGKSIRAMDGNVYTGIKILSPDYLQGKNKKVAEFRAYFWWQDLGTPSGYLKGRKYLIENGIKND